MMIQDTDLLKRLQNWYGLQCDGGWEHTYGISIDTLDNPGWSFKVNFTDTGLFGRAFEEVVFEGNDKNDWYQCRVKDRDFEGHCGPARLSDVITILLSWAGID
jgi:immunity protein 53 of polymorphic toxin system